MRRAMVGAMRIPPKHKYVKIDAEYNKVVEVYPGGDDESAAELKTGAPVTDAINKLSGSGYRLLEMTVPLGNGKYALFMVWE